MSMHLFFVRTRAALGAAASSLVFAACGGGNGQMPPASVPSQAAPSQSAPATAGATSSVRVSAATATYTLPLSNGFSGTISLSAPNAPPNASLKIHAVYPAVQTGPARSSKRMSPNTQACPPPPTISLTNPFPFPIKIRLFSFTIHVPCTPDGTLFGASFYQTAPQPSTVTSTKLGDATATGNTISFTPVVKSLTFPPMTTSAIAIRAETSTAEVALPVAPGSTTNLTSNAPSLPSALSFQYTTSTGGTSYSSACFNAHDSSGNLVPALQGVPIAGTPSIYCNIDPGTSSITFGQVVKFFVAAPKPDASVFEFDGPSSAYLCTNSSTAECDTPSFNVPTYQNLIVANAKSLVLCVPVTEDTDCNNVNNSPTPPPATQTVRAGQAFQLLVADDPTYTPGSANAPVPWSGLFTLTFGGQCKLDTGPDNDNGDVPPGYTDANQTG
ncbi:MAG: hypothetical protein ACLQPV_00345, partial [Vulcanimicrobiaceae bacterium]